MSSVFWYLVEGLSWLVEILYGIDKAMRSGEWDAAHAGGDARLARRTPRHKARLRAARLLKRARKKR